MRPISYLAIAAFIISLSVIVISGRARRHVVAYAAAMLSATSYPVAAKPPPPTIIGLNLAGLSYYSNDRPFANLMLGGQWQFASATARGWSELDPRFVDKDGNLSAVPSGGDVVRMLARPNTGPEGAAIRCTYQGEGEITARGDARNVFTKPGEVRFHWTNRWDGGVVWLQIHAINQRSPISRIDCREAKLPAGTRFAPEYVAALRGYRVLRFMDWQRTNGNAPVTWASRHTLGSLDIATGDGTALEDIVALSNSVGASPWVTVPWNADDDYIIRFARLFHDGIDSDRPIYVELSNEVWNGIFPVSRQSGREGIARGLATDYKQAILLRYAQRTIEVMRLWEKVFADKPTRIVRVASTFNLLPRTAETVLAYPELAQHIDALATAPYFGGDVMSEGPTGDPDEIFRRLKEHIAPTIALAAANRAVAARYSKRYLAYEAGQHILLRDVTLAQRVQRDPRMYDAYKQYLESWRAQVGDAIMLFASTGPIGHSGAWGLSEHIGQPLSEAPKLRAVLEERDR